MIQKFTIYRVGNLPASADQLGLHLQAEPFVPTAATQEHAIGFQPPRAEHGAFVEAIAGHWIARAVIERRSVPTPAIRKRAQEAADQIEATTGRKPGRKEMKALREDAHMALLPQAFPKQVAVPLWIDPQARILVIGATSSVVIDDVITALVRAVPDLTIAPLVTRVTPARAMGGWLADEHGVDHHAFSLGRECELQSNDEERAVVRYSRHHLQGEEVRRHVAEGKLPRRLALDWEGRVSFRLSDSMAIDKVQLLDLVFADRGDDDAADRFDADVAIYTAELSAMVADLIDVLGGEMNTMQDAVAHVGEALGPAALEALRSGELQPQEGGAA